jgi:hypothetical protein
MGNAKFYKVTFLHPSPGVDHRDFYFGSLAAIYDRFSVEDIGCAVSRLWSFKISPANPYRGRHCVISEEVLWRKQTKRGGAK